MRDRVAALTALAIAAARRRAADPDLADLLDDGALVDAAFAAGRSGAITALALALGDALPVAQRRYLTTIAAGAGAWGLHVAALALAAGEPAIAARAAAAELAARPGDGPIQSRILAGWSQAADGFWRGLLAAPEIGGFAPEVAEMLASFRGRTAPPDT
jgi:hypothetical protein